MIFDFEEFPLIDYSYIIISHLINPGGILLTIVIGL